MIRTILALVVLFCATFFLPFWVQLCLYVLAILLVSYRGLLLLPALFADAWYAPVRDFSIANNKTAIIVLCLICLYLFLVKKTRLGVRYGLEKK